ncbi:DoxX family protein [Nocardioides sp.]|uniref:DoxX family protein n=1 Tax=Nocardioides sp. TaxID=35761 RepID=UPI002BD390D0|nr:DoxX family protein [Nocardioides sp.]HXH77431.1 DoxX family protein [Nocardioides sp.]
MTTSSITRPSAPPAVKPGRSYWIVTGLFCAVFVFSALLTFVDPVAARAEIRHLEFPAYWAFPLAFLKLAGVAVILAGRWRRLTTYAFAGFLFDMMLAFGAHVAHSEMKAFQAAAGLLLWAGAVWVDYCRFDREETA